MESMEKIVHDDSVIVLKKTIKNKLWRITDLFEGNLQFDKEKENIIWMILFKILLDNEISKSKLKTKKVIKKILRMKSKLKEKGCERADKSDSNRVVLNWLFFERVLK